MVVAETSASAFGDDDFLSVFCHFAQYFTSLGIAADASQRHVKNLVGTSAAGAEVLAAILSVLGKYMLGVFQVQECPPLAVAAQDDMSAASPVATVGTSFGIVLHTKQVCRTGTAFARADEYFDIVDKVGCHG